MSPQGILILSYLPSYDIEGCRRGCCRSIFIDSDFAYHFAETEEAAATYIASRIQKRMEADWIHIILDDWTSAAQLGTCSLSEYNGVDSIQIPYFDMNNEYTQTKEQRRDRISALTAEKLEKWKVDLKEKELLIAQTQRVAEEERVRQQELAEYQRLQKKFDKDES